MPGALEAWLQARWYGGRRPGLVLRGLERVYRLLQARDAAAMRPERVGVPVIVVGNFTAGGTGKTPLVVALARHFAAAERRPGLVSRGHGRRGHAPLRVDADTGAREAGDEPRLLFEATGLPVFVDADRVAAARAAVAAGCGLVIADDGLQHRRLARDVEIEVVDGARGYGNGRLLPAGPLREPPRACDFRVVNGGNAGAGDWPMHLRLAAQARAVDAAPAPALRALAAFGGAPVAAVAGIGHPARFFEALRAAGLTVEAHPFADHHAFTAADFAGLRRPVLMTGKDAVKCRALGLDDAWEVPVEADLPQDFLRAVEARLAERRPDA